MLPTTPAPTVSPEGRSQADAAIGALLIVIGLAAGASWAVPDIGEYAPLIVGLACLGLFAFTRAYGFAVPAGIVTGVGVGVIVTSQASVEGGWFLMALALGFASIYPLGFLARPAVQNAWPLIPAAILALVGLSSLGRETDVPWGQVAGAGVLILIGVLLLLRGRRASLTD